MFTQFPLNPVNNETVNLGTVDFVYSQQYDTWAPVSLELPADVTTHQDLSLLFIGATRSVIYPKELINTLILWDQVRHERNLKFDAVGWRYERYARHARLGLSQVDNIADLDAYCQQLADITLQPDPANIQWPIL